MDMQLKEKCGIFGIYGHKDAARLTMLGLYALQHRGQEGAGICVAQDNLLKCIKGPGHVHEVFNESKLKLLYGEKTIGHVRYSTAGGSFEANIQPLVAKNFHGWIAVAHNGNITNAETIRKQLEEKGSIFQSTSDTEIIVHLIAHSKKRNLSERLSEALNQLKGAFSLLLMTETETILVRDRYGFRPLSLGQLDEGTQNKTSWVFSSETCAFDLIGAKHIRDIKPGEMLLVNDTGLHSQIIFPQVPTRSCVFEHVYFARPDSNLFGNNVYQTRVRMGRQLAQEHPIDADVVIPVPDGGVPSAIGYAQHSKIPFDMGIIRNHYVGRTFIQPDDTIRNLSLKIKLNPLRELLHGKRVVVVDDSLVRGNTAKKLFSILREAGAKELHLRISSPPITHPCYFGIDTPTKEELMASHYSIDEIREFIGADSLAYLSSSNMIQAASEGTKDPIGFCTGCFTGDYPESPF